MHPSFSAKVITAGVIIKALVMGTLVSLLAVTDFEKSIILVLVSACATGVFGIVIVLIQTHSEANLHKRIDYLENKANKIDQKTTSIDKKADNITAKTESIENAVTPTEET